MTPMNTPPDMLPPEAPPRVSHVEWLVTDLARSCAFLGGLFGWEFQVYSTHYRLYTPASGVCVGLMEVAEVSPATSTLVHIQVTDLDHYIQRGLHLGGHLATGPVELANYGRYAQLLDPDGHRIGLFQTAAQPAWT